jgi:hypothetical protein
MKSGKSLIGKYQRQYADLGFERGGLFELIHERYHPVEVLYPGCSIHVTPAFFFPHVVFVDYDPAASAFFSDHEAVLDLVKQRRNYKRCPHIQFISQDFTKPLPVRKNQFDLILALYAGGVSNACKSYLKRGGFLLTNNHHNDAVEATRDRELALVAIVQKRQGKYRFLEREPGELLKIRNQYTRTKRYLRQTSSGVEYIENESYYIFERTGRGQ